MTKTTDLLKSYGDTPWASITNQSRHVPDLVAIYTGQSKWIDLIPWYIDLETQAATCICCNTLHTRPTPSIADDKKLFFEAMCKDGINKIKYIETAKRAGKAVWHDYENIDNIWRTFLWTCLGPQMVHTLDIIASRTFLKGNSFNILKNSGGTTSEWDQCPTLDFTKMDNTSSFGSAPNKTKDIFDKIKRPKSKRATYGSIDFDGNLPSDIVVAFTTPGAVFNIKKQHDDYKTGIHYAAPLRFLRGDYGEWNGVLFIVDPDMHLLNCGKVKKQVAITGKLYPGSGHACNVDANRTMGQDTLPPGANHFIECSDFDHTDFKVNDVITIHRTRTNRFNITDSPDGGNGYNTSAGDAIGVNPEEGEAVNARIVKVDAMANTLAIESPMPWDYTNEVTTGVYGYITKAVHISQTVVFTGPRPLIGGTSQPPTIVEDMQDNRLTLTWSTFIGYQVWNDASSETLYTVEPFTLEDLRQINV